MRIIKSTSLFTLVFFVITTGMMMPAMAMNKQKILENKVKEIKRGYETHGNAWYKWKFTRSFEEDYLRFCVKLKTIVQEWIYSEPEIEESIVKVLAIGTKKLEKKFTLNENEIIGFYLKNKMRKHKFCNGIWTLSEIDEESIFPCPEVQMKKFLNNPKFKTGAALCIAAMHTLAKKIDSKMKYYQRLKEKDYTLEVKNYSRNWERVGVSREFSCKDKIQKKISKMLPENNLVLRCDQCGGRVIMTFKIKFWACPKCYPKYFN